MNDEKLKKNMAEILFPVLKGSRISCNEENACKQCWFPCEVDRLADSLADVLIAAGIGDVKEAEHRAEVSERALSSLVHEMYEHDIRPMCDEKFFIESRLIEAEKELEAESNVKN